MLERNLGFGSIDYKLEVKVLQRVCGKTLNFPVRYHIEFPEVIPCSNSALLRAGACIPQSALVLKHLELIRTKTLHAETHTRRTFGRIEIPGQ